MAQALQAQAGQYIADIRGEVQQPAVVKQLAASLLSAAFYLGIVLAFLLPAVMSSLPAGASLTRLLQRVTDAVKSNHTLLIVCLFACNVMAGQLLQTGAFEVLMAPGWDDGQQELVWSKLQTGALPTMHFLLEEVRRRATGPQ